MAHTQNTIVVYMTNEEKERIRISAKLYSKSMSRYLLDLYLNRSLGPESPPRPKHHHPVA